MPVSVGEFEYLTLAEVALAVGVTRQTLWRWRRNGKVPAGMRLRDGRILYGSRDVAAVRTFAEELTPLQVIGSNASAGE